MARPRKHDRLQIVDAICKQIAGGTLVKDACIAQGITRQRLHEWTCCDKALADIYARAREDQAHSIAEEAIALADNAVPGKRGDVDKVRVQVDARKWLASKIAPRFYGERVEQRVVIDTQRMAGMSDAELEAIVKQAAKVAR